jgi:hypothetical protein
MIVAFVGAVISLAVAFGLQLSAEQTAAIIAVVQIALGLITRSQVTAPANLYEAASNILEPLAAPYIPDDNT